MKINRTGKNKRAFTVIEILTVLGIIGVLVAVTFIYLGQGRTEKELDTAANNVYAAIREAQNYSLTGEGVVEGCDIFRFRFQSEGNKYYVENIDGSGNVCAKVSEYELSSEVLFGESGLEITFAVPSGKTSVSGGVAAVVLTKKGLTHNVCVYPMGVVTHASDVCSDNP